VVDKITHAVCDMNDLTTKPFSYWDIAHVVAHDITVVPLREHNDIPNSHDRGRKFYKPWKVSGRNSASNIGIAHLLTTVFNTYQHLFNRHQYGYMKFDVNLYNKYWQVSFFFNLTCILDSILRQSHLE